MKTKQKISLFQIEQPDLINLLWSSILHQSNSRWRGSRVMLLKQHQPSIKNCSTRRQLKLTNLLDRSQLWQKHSVDQLPATNNLRFLALDREEASKQRFSALNWLVFSFNHTFPTVNWSSLVNLTAGSFCGFAISDVDNSNDKKLLRVGFMP
ncbi:hypothetical protein pipiens_013732 [Culex pipiens pipiens]|uniref:Uncharacterized protein n=1 Tax=Culex pipiens pipiens TaxID=38569 RepID=A0ABD1CXT7_CULPP